MVLEALDSTLHNISYRTHRAGGGKALRARFECRPGRHIAFLAILGPQGVETQRSDEEPLDRLQGVEVARISLRSERSWLASCNVGASLSSR